MLFFLSVIFFKALGDIEIKLLLIFDCVLPVDIWSVGCIMGEMVKGSVIFQGTDRILLRRIYVCIKVCVFFSFFSQTACSSFMKLQGCVKPWCDGLDIILLVSGQFCKVLFIRSCYTFDVSYLVLVQQSSPYLMCHLNIHFIFFIPVLILVFKKIKPYSDGNCFSRGHL